MLFPGADLDPLPLPTRMDPTQAWISILIVGAELPTSAIPIGHKKLVSDEGTREGKRETRQMDINRKTNLKRQSKMEMLECKYLRQFEGGKICQGSWFPSMITAPTLRVWG